MDQGFIDIITTMTKEQGVAVLVDGSWKKWLADYTGPQYPKETKLLKQILKANCAEYINSAVDVLERKQAVLVKLEDEENLSPKKSAEYLDLLGLLLKGDTSKCGVSIQPIAAPRETVQETKHSGLLDDVEIARRVMVVFFLVDASDNMGGMKIGMVNDMMKNLILEIRKVALENADFQSEIAVMEFSSGARWLTKNGLVEVEQYVWQNINVGGTTDMGEACSQLAKKLSHTTKEGFIRGYVGSYNGIIFMISGSKPTDDFDSGLAELKKNKLFKTSVKVAIAIGDNADIDVLERFAGYKKAVIKTHDPVVLARMIGDSLSVQGWDHRSDDPISIEEKIINYITRKG